MSKSQMTPGRWDYCGGDVYGPRGETVAKTWDEDDRSTREAEMVANGIAIAALPELVEALQAQHKMLTACILMFMGTGDANEIDPVAMSQAHTAGDRALAKLEGGDA